MKETALITGGSSGIGLALARLFVADGHDVVLVARDAARLADAARALGERVRVIARDLSETGAAEAVFAQLDAENIVPTVVVNNAGFGMRGSFASTDLRHELEMIEVNVVTLTTITKLALARMVPRRSGRILNVSSTAGFQPGPFTAVYSATKAYVLSLSEAVANEARGTGITVTTLCPGPTATAFEGRAGMGGSRLFRRGVQDVGSVARAAYAGLMRGKRLVIPGLRNKLLVQSLRISPRFGVLAIVRWLQQ